MVTAELTGGLDGSYFLASMNPPMLMVIAPATDAAIQAIIIVADELTRLLSPAASANGIIRPSISPIQIFLMK